MGFILQPCKKPSNSERHWSLTPVLKSSMPSWLSASITGSAWPTSLVSLLPASQISSQCLYVYERNTSFAPSSLGVGGKEWGVENYYEALKKVNDHKRTPGFSDLKISKLIVKSFAKYSQLCSHCLGKWNPFTKAQRKVCEKGILQ